MDGVPVIGGEREVGMVDEDGIHHRNQLVVDPNTLPVLHDDDVTVEEAVRCTPRTHWEVPGAVDIHCHSTMRVVVALPYFHTVMVERLQMPHNRKNRKHGGGLSRHQDHRVDEEESLQLQKEESPWFLSLL
jgi:hypothetical protein